MVTPALFLYVHPDGGTGHDRLEAAMFWVGALLAFLPIVILLGVLGFVRWQRRRVGQEESCRRGSCERIAGSR